MGIGAGTSVLADRVLVAVFGDDAVRKLGRIAKERLDARVEGLMAAQLVRFNQVLDATEVSAEVSRDIRESAAACAAATGGAAVSLAPGVLTAGGRAGLPGVAAPPELGAGDPVRVQLRQVDADGHEVVEAEMLDEDRR